MTVMEMWWWRSSGGAHIGTACSPHGPAKPPDMAAKPRDRSAKPPDGRRSRQDVELCPCVGEVAKRYQNFSYG